MRRELALAFLAACGLIACATEPAPLDRTQPEAVNKAMFAGEWIYKMTVTDADFENLYTFIGEETASYRGEAFKVRWEVTQDLLNAYKVPQRYRDASGNLVENAIGDKSLVLSFRIKKHYDIRYRYNSTTREDLNVIEENYDRPWSEREYMEVDWSQSLVSAVSNPTILDISTGAVTREPVSVSENFEFFARGPDKDHDIRVDTRSWNPATDPEVYVMNIDTKEALTTTLRTWQQLFSGYVPPSTTKIRHSLMKAAAPDQNPYVAKRYDDDVFRRFGYFRTVYNVWDPERGVLESQKAYLINRWNFADGQKLVWYASPSTQAQLDAGDAQLKAVMEKAIGEWNVALREATGRTDDPMSFAENEPLKDREGNPVYNLDGSMRWKYELGDLRYSFINVVDKPQGASPIGYGPATPDSDTGEFVNATVNLYSAKMDWYLRFAMDQYDVAAGFCTLDDVKDGHYYDPDTGLCNASDWVGEYKGGVLGKTASALVLPKPPARNPTRTLTPALMTAWYPKGDVRAPTRALPPEQRELARQQMAQWFAWDQQHPTALNLNGFKQISSSAYEGQTVPQASLMGLAPAATSADDPGVVASLSPANRLSPEFLAAMKERELRRITYFDDTEMFEPSVHAFVEDMKNVPRDEAYRTLREWSYYSSCLHEMGHTLGLRHNFRASVDRANFPAEYFPAYADYWEKIEAVRAKHQAAIDEGDEEAYRAYVQEVDDIPARHDRFASSSIMDYMGDWQKWNYPVGSWDRAAILFGYGDKVEVRNDAGEWVLDVYRDGDFRQHDPTDDAELAESGRKVRNYLFCSDEKTFDDAFCNMHDIGTTLTEIVRNKIRDAQTSYFFMNFRRNSARFDSRRAGYYERMWLYHYYNLTKPLAEVTLSTLRYPEFWSSLWDGVEKIMAGPESRDLRPGYHHDGGEDLLRAMLLTYNYLLYDVIGRPDSGYHKLSYDTRGARVFEQIPDRYLDPTSDVYGYVPAGTGWGWMDEYDVQQDIQHYYPHLERIGVEMDKVIAFEVLSIPAALNAPLQYEKANGANFWNSIWTNNGSQIWEMARGLISGNFSSPATAWCMRCDDACRADPANHPPRPMAYPVGLLDGLERSGLLGKAPAPIESRCGADEYPIQPGMDDLFAIFPIFYAIGGASHPWYTNQLSDYLDSQVIGGHHQFTPPAGAPTLSFINSSGTRTYQAAQTEDGNSIAYQLVENGARLRAKVDFFESCRQGKTPPAEVVELAGDRPCNEVLGSCYCAFVTCPPRPDWCDSEGWDSSFTLDALKYRNLDRIEAMLIMMQDMIDLAGHYAWRTPGFMQEP